jgi:hypothetical protein
LLKAIRKRKRGSLGSYRDLQSGDLAVENEICLSDEIYSLTDAADLLAAMQSNVRTVHVKGIARKIAVHALRVRHQGQR